MVYTPVMAGLRLLEQGDMLRDTWRSPLRSREGSVSFATCLSTSHWMLPLGDF